MAARQFSNVAVITALTTGISNSETSLTVDNATGWPVAPFMLVIEPDTGSEELILVGSKSGSIFSSLTRGFGGTPAVSHSAGAVIKHVSVAEDHRLIFTHLHVPGTDDTAQISHDNLSGVSANDHHNQAHAIGGADHTGQLDHGVLSGLSDDDHAQYLKEKASGGLASEVPEHAHAAAGSGGTIDHGALIGLSDDDHPQYLTAADVVNLLYPVGSLWFSELATNPGTLFGVGTWSRVGEGQVLVGLNAADVDFDTLGETGGSKTQPTHVHTITHTHQVDPPSTVSGGPSDDIPGSSVSEGPVASDTHTHTTNIAAFTSGGSSAANAGANGGDSVVQPYRVVNIWKRTA